jgi:pyruvate formate lyase activating enzyme
MKEALFYIEQDNRKIRCNLCAHYCELKTGQYGICGVRQNIDGKLYSLNYGIVQGIAIDPIEKKPFYHFMPGTEVLSFGLPGCNFKCANCQNSDLSQNIKKYRNNLINAKDKIPPSVIVDYAIRYKVSGIAYTYSEPTIFFEYAYDIINECKRREETKHLKHMFISNGYFSKELTDFIISEKLLDAVNIDLKFFDDRQYRKITGGSLTPVLENIQRLGQSEIHLEIINLIIPHENDTDEDFNNISSFIASIDKSIPLHFSRFFPHYKMTDRDATPIERLIAAKKIAESNGLKYVYIGNAAGTGFSDTFCPNCKSLLIKRTGYKTTIINLQQSNGKYYCGNCGCEINIR